MVDFCMYKKGGNSSINEEVDLIIQQTDILFDTTPTEVLGFETFGTKYDEYLYDTKLSASNLQSIVEQDLGELNLMGWSYNVSVDLLQGTEKDIALISIDFYKGSETIQRFRNI